LGFLDENDLGELLAGFSRSAFRFETREAYNSDIGRQSFRRFLAGEPDDFAWHLSWLEKIRQDRRMGKLWQRVRIVSVPLSDYTRYGIRVARLSADAGEDIRYLRRDVAQRLGLTPYDAWLLDHRTLVHLHFNDEDDTFRGAEMVVDEAVVARHLGWRALAWDHAEPLEEFAAENS
jgi:hypothetical protein